MRASPDQWLHHTGAPRHLQATTEGTPGPHRSHKKGFSTVLINTHKGFCLLTPQRSHPTLLNRLSLNMLYIMEGALRKETPASPKRVVGSRPKHSTSIFHSRHYTINARELGLK